MRGKLDWVDPGVDNWAHQLHSNPSLDCITDVLHRACHSVVGAPVALWPRAAL